MTTLQQTILLITFVLTSCKDTRTDVHSAEAFPKIIYASGLSNHDTIMRDGKPTVVFHVGTDSITIGRLNGGPSCEDNAIYFNDKLICCDTVNEFVYDSKYNRVIVDKNQILLFIEILGQPNYNRVVAYSLSDLSAKLLVDCVYNDEKQGNGIPPFTDMDQDGYLELGGFDLTEQHPSADSMYYMPSEYYEIRNGTVAFDSALTKKMDMAENGIYLKHPIDKNGNCCIVIAKPKH